MSNEWDGYSLLIRLSRARLTCEMTRRAQRREIDANCYFGPPLPVPNGPLSTCVINTFLTDLCGSINLLPPSATFATALSARVYLTSNETQPCPICAAGFCRRWEECR